MPEGTKQAAILIATSFRAMNRASLGRKETLVPDAVIMMLFAGFYVEATLNYITEYTGSAASMASFVRKRYPGMQDKLAWFYNRFVAKRKAATKKQLYITGIEAKPRRRYPGFAELYRFRNDLSHGQVNRCAGSLATAKRLRQNAKDLVADLYAVASKKTRSEIPRIVTYHHAIAAFSDIKPWVRCS
jgi:hypothetical protein